MTGFTILAEAAREFDSLVALPVLMGGREFGEDRDYLLDEVKDLLLARATSPRTRDLIWRDEANVLRPVDPLMGLYLRSL